MFFGQALGMYIKMRGKMSCDTKNYLCKWKNFYVLVVIHQIHQNCPLPNFSPHSMSDNTNKCLVIKS